MNDAHGFVTILLDADENLAFVHTQREFTTVGSCAEVKACRQFGRKTEARQYRKGF